ncbi:MAG TPA: metallophosphoesterase family protein [Candidatus Polarisedimenticolia bacterium]|jgi:diadenosine tetraphosphatase ApaH/serine/threonine PP2A family protein phosphatase
MQDVSPGVLSLGSFRRVALLGGIYSNHLALREALKLARERKAETIVALGDFGAFGPHPDRTLEILREEKLPAIQGNYEESLAGGADDCHCGYTDPRDNRFAQISYDYTREKTSAGHTEWMATLPGHIRLTMGGRRLLLCHGSPRRINEFLFHSATPVPFIRRLLAEHEADLIVCTHTGIHWKRFIEPGRGVVNAGALGRPANDGRVNVWFTILEETAGGLDAEFVPVPYDHDRLAREMRDESLPPEFIETIQTGWWTSCLEILPAKERARGRY